MNNTLLELFQTAGQNDIEFTYRRGDGENILNLDLGNKTIDLTIGDPEHKDLEIMLRDAIMTIKGGS